MKFLESFSKAHSQSVLLDVLHSIAHDMKVVYCFDSWYYAVRFVRNSNVADFYRIFDGIPNGDNVRALFQIQALFKKREDLNVGVDKEAAAIDSFLTAERLCAETNRKLRDRDDPDYQRRAVLIFEMQRKISRILGDLPVPSALACAFGGGSNVGCSKITSVSSKLHTDVTSTVSAARELLGFAREDSPFTPWLKDKQLKLVDGSNFRTVPKTWKTDRGICVEPILNAFLQRGYGVHIRDRLRTSVGVNIRDQSLNQRLAMRGSRDGSLATIDLSMASDTVSYLLVLDLLPQSWFEALDAVRSPITVMPDGTHVILEKFSAMGNGFTFELETLIFWSLCSVVCPPGSIISAYGDDLIVPTSHYDHVIDALRLLGFVPNPDKSFGSGPFRESCGADYWDGENVRPHFLRQSISVSEIFKLHNWCVREGRLDSLIPKLLTRLPKGWVRYGPAGTGDGHLHDEDFISRDVIVDKRGWGHFVKYVSMKAIDWHHAPFPEASEYLSFLYYNTYKSLPKGTVWEDIGRTFRNDSEPLYRKRTLRHYCHFDSPLIYSL